MKLKTLIIALMMAVFSAGVYAQAEEAAAVPEVVVLNNPICPVSGEKNGQMGEPVTYEHEGKVYSFCCAMCIKDFQKDPAAYIKKVEEMMKADGAEAADAHEGHNHK